MLAASVLAEIRELAKSVAVAQTAFDDAWEKHKDDFEDRWFPGLRGLEWGVPVPPRLEALTMPSIMHDPEVIKARDDLAQAKMRLAESIMRHWTVITRQLEYVQVYAEEEST